MRGVLSRLVVRGGARGSCAQPTATAAVTATPERCDSCRSTTYRISSTAEWGLLFATTAALAHLANDIGDENAAGRGASCKDEKMVWVESHGKKVGGCERSEQMDLSGRVLVSRTVSYISH